MKRLTCLFIIQGEGRGHLTQALALSVMLARAGHHVCGAIVSQGENHTTPSFFEKQFGAPVTYVESAHFVVDGQSQSIDWPKTLATNSTRWNQFAEAFSIIHTHIQLGKPDVLINFYEPLGGLFVLRYKPPLPMIAVAHQFMFLHPEYQFPEGFAIQKRSTMLFTHLTGMGAARRLALSLYDAEPLPSKRLMVIPPLLRDELFALKPSQAEPFFLVYLFHHSLAEALINWHQHHPDVPVHCYWNNPEAEETTVHGKTLTFHQLHGQHFLEKMAASRGVVTTSGFESMAEAMYLAKPLLLNPVRKHFEQHCNADDGHRMGAAVQSDDFNLSRLIRFASEYRFDATRFRQWVSQAEQMVIQHIEAAADA